jgi:hypothetical protein
MTNRPMAIETVSGERTEIGVRLLSKLRYVESFCFSCIADLVHTAQNCQKSFIPARTVFSSTDKRQQLFPYCTPSPQCRHTLILYLAKCQLHALVIFFRFIAVLCIRSYLLFILIYQHFFAVNRVLCWETGRCAK